MLKINGGADRGVSYVTMEKNVETMEIKIAITAITPDERNERPRKVKVRRGSSEEKPFAEYRNDELSGLVRDGNFFK